MLSLGQQDSANQSTWAETVLGKIDTTYAQAFPSKPEDTIPTLEGSPDEMDLGQADRLHVRASRWLEYLSVILARAEAKLLLRQAEASDFKKRLDFKYKRKVVEKATEEEFEELIRLERLVAEDEAEVVVLKGLYKRLEKVKVAASRTITKHTKAAPGFALD